MCVDYKYKCSLSSCYDVTPIQGGTIDSGDLFKTVRKTRSGGGLPLKRRSPLREAGCPPHEASFFFASWLHYRKKDQNRLNPKKTGGGGLKGPPPRHFARLLCNAQSSRRDTLWLFSFKFPAHFDTKINLWRPGVRFWSYVTFCTCTSDRKMAPKCDFVYKINANWFFFTYSTYKYAYFYSQWLKWIVLALLCFKKCLPQISPKKTTKTKGKKTKKFIHKKFIKQ